MKHGLKFQWHDTDVYRFVFLIFPGSRGKRGVRRQAVSDVPRQLRRIRPASVEVKYYKHVRRARTTLFVVSTYSIVLSNANFPVLTLIHNCLAKNLVRFIAIATKKKKTYDVAGDSEKTSLL